MKLTRLLTENQQFSYVTTLAGIKDITDVIDVTGDVKLSDQKIEEFGVTFGKVGGNFYCNRNKLVTLKGAPREVRGSFSCSENPKLVSLEGGPTSVMAEYFCYSCPKLRSFKGAPSEARIFDCSNTKATTLEGIPSLIDEILDCSEMTKLKSLEGIHKHLKKCPKIDLTNTLFTSGGIGLLLVEGLMKIQTTSAPGPQDLPCRRAIAIFRKYLGQGKKGLLLCQEELVDAGLEDFAKL